FAFDCARARHNDNIFIADDDVAYRYRRVIRFKLATDELIRMGNFDKFDNTGHVLEKARFDWTRIARQSDRGAAGARHRMRLKPQLFNFFTYARHILGGGIQSHYDEQMSGILPPTRFICRLSDLIVRYVLFLVRLPAYRA